MKKKRNQTKDTSKPALTSCSKISGSCKFLLCHPCFDRKLVGLPPLYSGHCHFFFILADSLYVYSYFTLSATGISPQQQRPLKCLSMVKNNLLTTMPLKVSGEGSRLLSEINSNQICILKIKA